MTISVPPRRKESRAPGLRQGVVKLGLFKRLKFEVADFSVNGAKLIGGDFAELPETFDLSVQGTGKTRTFSCVKRWQDNHAVGVEFVVD